jgi:hypothetical protein
MRFMIIRHADEQTEAGAMPSQELMEQMGSYMMEMVNAGGMLAGDGLQPSSKGARVRFAGGETTVVDGPFAETKELVAGYNVIDVGSREEAIAWVERWPAAVDNNPTIEIRRIFEADDFGEALTPELREAEERLRARTADQE